MSYGRFQSKLNDAHHLFPILRSGFLSLMKICANVLISFPLIVPLGSQLKIKSVNIFI